MKKKLSLNLLSINHIFENICESTIEEIDKIMENIKEVNGMNTLNNL